MGDHQRTHPEEMEGVVGLYEKVGAKTNPFVPSRRSPGTEGLWDFVSDGSVGLALLAASCGQPSARTSPGFRWAKSGSCRSVAQSCCRRSGPQDRRFCANCHGESGVSKLADVPNLAGQNPAYPAMSRSGNSEPENARTPSQGLIKVLKEDERVAMAVYFSSQDVTAGKGNAAWSRWAATTSASYASAATASRRMVPKPFPGSRDSRSSTSSGALPHRDKSGERIFP